MCRMQLRNYATNVVTKNISNDSALVFKVERRRALYVMQCLTIARVGTYRKFRFLQGVIGDAAAVSNSAGAVWKLFLIRFLHVLMSMFMRFLAFCFCIFADNASHALGAASATENTDLVNYAEVRKRVTRSFPEKANEIADVIAVLQEISRSTVDLSKQISARCS